MPRIAQRSRKQVKFRRHIASLNSNEATPSEDSTITSSSNYNNFSGKDGTSEDSAGTNATPVPYRPKPRSSFYSLATRSLPSNTSLDSVESSSSAHSHKKLSIKKEEKQSNTNSASAKKDFKGGLHSRIVSHKSRPERSLSRTRTPSIDLPSNTSQDSAVSSSSSHRKKLSIKNGKKESNTSSASAKKEFKGGLHGKMVTHKSRRERSLS